MTVERGIDPRDHALVAFGGAGPLHAVAIAEELGIERVIAPRASGVLAALGLVVAPRRRDAQRSVLRAGATLTADAVAADVAALAEAARAALGEPDAEIAVTYELRYRGQAFELAIPAPSAEPALTPDALRDGVRGRARGALRLPRPRAGDRAGDGACKCDRRRARRRRARVERADRRRGRPATRHDVRRPDRRPAAGVDARDPGGLERDGARRWGDRRAARTREEAA